MKKEISKSSRARELIKQGDLTAKQIARRVGLNISTIYTIKWKMDNKQGLGAIKPKTPAVGKGTGIAAAIPLEFEIIDRPKKKSNNRRQGQLKRWERERELREERERMEAKGFELARTYIKTKTPYQVTEVTPPPTLWQKIKSFFGA